VHRVNCWKPKATMDAKVISSQVSDVAATAVRAENGSETSSRAKAVMEPRAPETCAAGQDIVRHSDGNAESSPKQRAQLMRDVPDGRRSALAVDHQAAGVQHRQLIGGASERSDADNRVNCGKATDGDSLPSMLIRSQAEGSAKHGTSEGSETRGVSNASDNRPHECPASSIEDDEIVRHSGESRRVRLNSARN